MITPKLITRSKKVCASFHLDDKVTVYLFNGASFTGTVGESDDVENVLGLYQFDRERTLIMIDIVNNPIVAHSILNDN